MNPTRFYCKSLESSIAELDVSESRHLTSVLRIRIGQKVELFDGLGKLAVGVVETAAPKKVTLRIEQVQIVPESAGPKIIITASIAKGERFDWLISKCTELGVDGICPVLFERTVKQTKNPRAMERWRNLAIAASKQCRRGFLPTINIPVTLPAALENLKKDYPKADILIGSLDKQAVSLMNVEFSSEDVIAFIGPEGGLTKDEEELLKKSGAKPVRLTDTILRIETAAVSFAAILAAQRDKRLKTCQ